MGNEVVRTPNLDELAARGMVFENAWVANPVCMPNRSTLMTGRLPSAHGVIFNDRSLEWGANTWVLEAVLNLDVDLSLYDQPSLLMPRDVDRAIEGNLDMLERASPGRFVCG